MPRSLIRTTALLLATIGIPSASALAQDPPLKEKQVVATEMEIRTSSTVELKMHAGGCKANLALEYWQEGPMARVDTTIVNEACGASSGDYRILVMYRGDDGETVTDEYPEEWQRDGAEPVVTSKTYEIGNGVDLVRVRSRGLSCSCASDEEAAGQ